MKDIVWESELSHSTKEGVQYWGIAKEMELIYTVETTRHDDEVALDFSNVHVVPCKSMTALIQTFNLYQNQGFKNIQIGTLVKHKGETVIEDTSECLELSVNTEGIKQLRNENRQLEALTEELSLYTGFVKQYKAEKTFDTYVTDRKNSDVNKDTDGLYWYEMRLRPVSPRCQPKGFLQTDDTKGRHGIIAYNRPLTPGEVDEYDLGLWPVN